MIPILWPFPATQQQSGMGNTLFFNTNTDTSIIIWTSVILILVSVNKLQRYRYLYCYSDLSDNLFSTKLIRLLKSLTGHQDTDTSSTSWASVILIPALVSLAGAQRYQFRY